MNYQKLNCLALSTSLGLTWGLSIFILGLIGTHCQLGIDIINMIGQLYVGFEPTFLGSIIGFIISFIDAFIGGLILATIYNFIINKSNK
ncbi:MAG: bacteriophage holin [Legionellales bacterium]|nr:bacteriophage holin [Legionellales bacterium]